MKLDQFYSLRTSFTIIGLTGHVGGGCSSIARKLSNQDVIKNIEIKPSKEQSFLENIKDNICLNYLRGNGNWQDFQIINYKDVLLLHLVHTAALKNENKDTVERIITTITQNGKRQGWKNRFDTDDDHQFISEKLIPFLKSNYTLFEEIRAGLQQEKLSEALKENKELSFDLFFNQFNSFAAKFYKLLNSHSIIKRSRLTHDLANNLRANGTVITDESQPDYNLDHIYTIAETINQLIKVWRSKKDTAKIVIDALKNSLELMFFKEKYAAFYMVAANRDEINRRKYLLEKLSVEILDSALLEETVNQLILLDDAEYKANNFKDGNFTTPDIENCIQKCDYHIHIDSDKELGVDVQIIRFVALINQPGIITPTIHEHFMQVAYNAKFNSGCISRQVGAVVTDANNSIKAIGWNDVPEYQVPCSLRDVRDLINGSNSEVFTQYELHSGDYGGKTFLQKSKEVLNDAHFKDINGKNCSFCFKSFHNAFEGEKNQVHTRSLHAEENAMLQITKFGGQGIKNGNLYTTASPCELCSKKAYQLGIKNIYYIDPYPGIAKTQILEGGKNNPTLIMFQGAVGRAFHKLYEPYMAYKDEISILTGIKPKEKIEDSLKSLIPKAIDKLSEVFSGKTEKEKIDFLEGIINTSLEKMK